MQIILKRMEINMNKERVLFEIIQDFFMCMVITLTVTLLNNGNVLSFQFVLDFLLAYVINLVVGFLLPEMVIAKWLTKKIKDGKVVKEKLLIPSIIAIINVTIILSGVLLFKIGIHPPYINVWISLYPTLIIVGIVAACIFFGVTGRIVKMFMNK